jgi:hypothetical protein
LRILLGNAMMAVAAVKNIYTHFERGPVPTGSFRNGITASIIWPNNSCICLWHPSPHAEMAIRAACRYRQSAIKEMTISNSKVQDKHLGCQSEAVVKLTQAFQLHGDLYTLYFFSLFWGHVFFAFQHNLGTFCRGELLKLVWTSVAKIWSRSLILLFGIWDFRH